MSGIIKLDTISADTIRKQWRELNENHPKKDDAYYDEAGKILNDELEMYKSKLTTLSDEEKEKLIADLLTHQQKTDLDEIRRIIEEKNVDSPIDEKFNAFLSSISQQRSKLGGRKSNKRSRSRSQNKRYSRRRSNVGKRRQYSSRRK
jgi:phenylpropionate dioxygenase-like ring-hydroxylating dioxygenase large terminal subunit